MNNIEKIKALLNQFSDKEPILKPKHIFADLIQHFEDALEKQNVNSLFYYMSLSEKCLDSYRKRNIPLGDFYYNNLQQYTSSFLPPIKNGMLSLHDALAAYKAFVEGDNKNAISLLNSAINNAESQWGTFPYFIIATSEQQLNKIRVYINNKDHAAFLSETKIVLFNLITNQNPKFITLSYEEKFGMLQHIFNSIEIAAYKSFGTDESVVEVFDNILNMIGNEKKIISAEFSDLEKYIYYYTNLDINYKKNPAFFHQIFEYKIPKSLKKILLFKINNISVEQVSIFIEEQLFKKNPS